MPAGHRPARCIAIPASNVRGMIWSIATRLGVGGGKLSKVFPAAKGGKREAARIHPSAFILFMDCRIPALSP